MADKETTPPTREEVAPVIYTALETFGVDPQVIKDGGLELEFDAVDIDSLDLAELSQILDEKYGVVLTAEDVKTVVTVGDVVDLVAGCDDGDESKVPAAA